MLKYLVIMFVTSVNNILFSMNKFLHNKRIKWFTDNQNVVRIINKGSMKRKLQDIAISMLNHSLTPFHLTVSASIPIAVIVH
jgi:hypothetical protein